MTPERRSPFPAVRAGAHTRALRSTPGDTRRTHLGHAPFEGGHPAADRPRRHAPQRPDPHSQRLHDAKLLEVAAVGGGDRPSMTQAVAIRAARDLNAAHTTAPMSTTTAALPAYDISTPISNGLATYPAMHSRAARAMTVSESSRRAGEARAGWSACAMATLRWAKATNAKSVSTQTRSRRKCTSQFRCSSSAPPRSPSRP